MNLQVTLTPNGISGDFTVEVSMNGTELFKTDEGHMEMEGPCLPHEEKFDELGPDLHFEVESMIQDNIAKHQGFIQPETKEFETWED